MTTLDARRSSARTPGTRSASPAPQRARMRARARHNVASTIAPPRSRHSVAPCRVQGGAGVAGALRGATGAPIGATTGAPTGAATGAPTGALIGALGRALTGALTLALATALVVVAFGAGDARAQGLFSPGPLHKAHAALEGVGQCGKCHAEGGGGDQHDDKKCMGCHEEIAKRRGRGEGYHARVGAKQCADCHQEHRGADSALIDWVPSKKGFNHAQTGWALTGEHKKQECKTCHEDARRIVEKDARELQAKARPQTLLGLAAKCTSCHFDEHRSQEGESCEKCHAPDADWRTAKGFSHNKNARFALTGRHTAVSCEKCHAEIIDDEAAPAFPKRRSESYLQLKGLPFASCANCHTDVHKGQFGKGCATCHQTSGWRDIKKGAEDFGFHEKTDFPLRGEHTSVACKSCHGPFPGEKAVFKGLKHEGCQDCHFDAHAGQMKKPQCTRCHDVTGFKPVKVDGTIHKETRFPLEGAHLAVACNQCHKDDPKIERRVAPSIKSEVARKGRKLLVSGITLDLLPSDEAAKKCETCHKDPHEGQFEERVQQQGCASCHQVSSFRATIFDHADSRFPLTGKHEDAKCSGCHVAEGAKKNVVIYRPLKTDCAGCHADEHVGQLERSGVTDCSRCHETRGFKPITAKFNHNDASITSFALEGKHAGVKCTSCHPSADVGGGDVATRYKPLPQTCGACHEDEHNGRYDKFRPPAPSSSAEPAPAPAAAATTTKGTDPSACASCHVPAGFLPARFAHEKTDFPLVGRHAGLACSLCHGSDTSRTTPQSCAACHSDPHVQEFGLSCAGCHDFQSFRAPRFAVDAHRRNAFPLVGRHAGLPCEECHVDKRDRTFTRAALTCNTCHARDAQRATLVSVNHTRAPFNAPTCNACHEPATFTPARFPGHELCFPIARSVHAPVRCTECHTTLRGAVANGSCSGVPVACADCHVHAAEIEAANHRDVQGYEHESEKCAGCHKPL